MENKNEDEPGGKSRGLVYGPNHRETDKRELYRHSQLVRRSRQIKK